MEGALYDRLSVTFNVSELHTLFCLQWKPARQAAGKCAPTRADVGAWHGKIHNLNREDIYVPDTVMHI